MEAKLIKVENTFYLKQGGTILGTSSSPNLSASIRYSLSLKNCQAIERGYDLDELVKSKYPNVDNEDYEYFSEAEMLRDEYKSRGFYEGAKAIIELMGDKKFSEDQMKRIYEKGYSAGRNELNSRESDKIKYDYIQSLQQTEWEVEIEMEYYDTLPPTRQTGLRPKLDADGCLILKRK